jgi:hypothetical protein
LQEKEENCFSRKRYLKRVKHIKKPNIFPMIKTDNNIDEESTNTNNEESNELLNHSDFLSPSIEFNCMTPKFPDLSTENIITADDHSAKLTRKPPLSPISYKPPQKDSAGLISCINPQEHNFHSSQVYTKLLKKLSVKSQEDKEKQSEDYKTEGAATWREVNKDMKIATQEDYGDTDLLGDETPRKTISESSTPHRYTDYKSRLHNILLLNFSSGSNDSNSEDIHSLSSDSAIDVIN